MSSNDRLVGSVATGELTACGPTFRVSSADVSGLPEFGSPALSSCALFSSAARPFVASRFGLLLESGDAVIGDRDAIAMGDAFEKFAEESKSSSSSTGGAWTSPFAGPALSLESVKVLFAEKFNPLKLRSLARRDDPVNLLNKQHQHERQCVLKFGHPIQH